MSLLPHLAGPYMPHLPPLLWSVCFLIHQAPKGKALPEHFLGPYLCEAVHEVVTFLLSLSSLRMLLAPWSYAQWGYQTIFPCLRKSLLTDKKDVREIQYLSLATFCLGNWATLANFALATTSLPTLLRDESRSQALGSSVSRDKLLPTEAPRWLFHDLPS